MKNEILNQIIASFSIGEEFVDSIKMYHENKKCAVFIVLSNKRIFLYDNLVKNENVDFYSLKHILKIEKLEDQITLDIIEKEAINFSYIQETPEIIRFLEKLALLTNPIIEKQKKDEEQKNLDKRGKRIKHFVTGMLIIAIIVTVSVGGTLTYRYYLQLQEESTKEEQSAKKAAAQKEIDSQVEKAENQIIFGTNFKKRLDVYNTFLQEVNSAIKNIDISDKTMNWKELKNKIDENSIKFNSIKIVNEDATDYGISVNEEKDYIKTKIGIINQNIESVLNNTKDNIDNQFSNNPALLINIKQTIEDTTKLINKLQKDIDTEADLISKTIVDMKKDK